MQLVPECKFYGGGLEPEGRYPPSPPPLDDTLVTVVYESSRFIARSFFFQDTRQRMVVSAFKGPDCVRDVKVGFFVHKTA